MVRGDLGHTQCFELWEVEDEFRRRFGAHGHLKFKLNTVDEPSFTGLVNEVVGYDKPRSAHRQRST